MVLIDNLRSHVYPSTREFVTGCGRILAVLALIHILGGSAAAQSVSWQATFDEGNFREWNGGFRNTTGMAISETGCQSGRCVRATLAAGTNSDNYADFHFGDHVTIGQAKVEEVWLRLWSKFETGYLWPNRSQKMAILNLTDGQTLTRHYQIIVYVRPNGDYAVDHSDLDNWRFWGLFQNIGTPVQVRWNQWEKMKLYVRLNTPNVANGVVRLWINDELKVDYSNVNIRAATNYGLNKLNLSSYATQSSPNNGVQWWDSFMLSSADPDGAAPSPPGPPTNVRVIR